MYAKGTTKSWYEKRIEKSQLSSGPITEKSFYVMLFGPTNAPSFYTATMTGFKGKWDTLFIICLLALKSFSFISITLTAVDAVIIGDS